MQEDLEEPWLEGFPFEESGAGQSVDESCAGLDYVGTRRLEKSEIGRITRLGLVYYAGALCAAPATVVVMLVACAFALSIFPRPTRSLDSALAVVMIILLPTLLGLLALFCLRRGRRLFRIRKHNFVRQFQGRLNLIDATDPSLRTLSEAGLLKRINPNEETTIELVPYTDELYSLNGLPVQDPLKMHITRGTRPPEHMTILDTPASWFEERPAEPIKRRRITYEEFGELVSYTRLGRSFWFAAAAQYLIYALLLDRLLTLAHLQRLSALPLALVLSALMVGSYIYHLGRGIKLLRADAGVGWVLIHPLSEKNGTPTIELLAVSHKVWTIGGKPAGWRKASNGSL